MLSPGPWRVSTFETVSKDRVVMGSDDFSICHVGERSREENIDNAYLIASSYEMIAALKAWEYWYSDDSSELNRETARELGLRAITKAGCL